MDYALTTSCYDPSPDGAACAHCDACQLRMKGFAEAGIPDPTRYADGRAETSPPDDPSALSRIPS